MKENGGVYHLVMALKCSIQIGKIAIQICYDSEFLKWRESQWKRSKIIFTPFSTEDRQSYLRVKYCCMARAIETKFTQEHVVTPN